MTQPEALQVADMLEAGNSGYPSRAAAELRRLHAELERCKQVCAATAEGWRVERGSLLEALKNIERSTYDAGTAALARVAISKTEENT